MQIQPISVSASTPVMSATDQAAVNQQSLSLPASGAAKPVETQTQQAVQAVSPQEQAAELKEAVSNLNSMVSAMGRGLEFSVDEDTRINLVKVVDTQSKEVIRQIPSEEVVQISRWLDKLQGILLRDKV